MRTTLTLAGILGSLWLAYVSFTAFADANVPMAQVLGWAFVIVGFFLVPSLVIAMIVDFQNPVKED